MSSIRSFPSVPFSIPFLSGSRRGLHRCRQRVASDWNLLANFSKGLAGGGTLPRSKFIYDTVNLPQVGQWLTVGGCLGVA